MKTIGRLAAGVALVLAFAPAASAALPETLALNTYDAGTADFTPVIASTDALTAGQFYVATVTGTFSNVAATHWTERETCGSPEADAMFPSPGRPASRVGKDAEWAFAHTRIGTGGCGPLPERGTAFQVATNGTFGHPSQPIGGAGSAPRGSHSYAYLLAGTGGPVRFRLRDVNTRDNYGVLQIVLRAATPADCGTTPACPGPTTPPTPPGGGGAPPAGGGTLGATQQQGGTQGATTRTCASKRAFRIKIRFFRKDPVVSATVTLLGKKLKVTKIRGPFKGTKQLTALISFKGQPPARYNVPIRARTRSGKVLRNTRKYRTCTRHIPGRIPKL